MIALINERDQQHQRATALSAAYDRGRFLITEAVLLEIGNALARNFRQEAERVIADFLSSDDVLVIRASPALFDEAFALYRAHQDKEWGLTDCVSFVAMRQAGIQDALTFDQHFVQAGFRALMRD